MKDDNYSVQQLVNDPSFVEWALGNSAGEKADYWNQWIQQSEQNRKKALRAQKEITGLRFTHPRVPDIREEWSRVRQDITGEERGTAATIARQAKQKRTRVVSYLFKAAAMLLVGAFAGLAIYTYQEPQSAQKQVAIQTIETGFEEKKTLTLSDGSSIVLAAGSQLSYKSNWLDQPVKRVSLEGEAYFSISGQETRDKPKFVVETEDGSASVFGTRFTVDTYGEGTRVVLEEGEVHIDVANTPESEQSGITIKPGEMARFNSSQPQIRLEQVNPAVYTSWTTNELYFDETPFSVLVERIRRTYGKEVIVKDKELLDKKLSGSIDFRSLDGLINAVSEVMEVEIYKTEQTVTIESNQQ